MAEILWHRHWYPREMRSKECLQIFHTDMTCSISKNKIDWFLGKDSSFYSFDFDLNIWFRTRKVTWTFEKRANHIPPTYKRHFNFCPRVGGSHMKKIIKKVSSGIGAIKRVRHLVPQATLQLIYQALIHPHFNYCNTVWAGNCGITLKEQTSKTTK